jgi:hypothetical protein
MSLPITLYLIGFAGTGKYTIAKELAETSYKLIDNHLINNPIFSLLDLESTTPIPEEAWDAIHKIREAVLDFIAQDRKNNYVLTNELLEDDYDHVLFNQVKHVAEKKGSLLIPIILVVSDEEHQKRMTNPQRKDRLKETTYPAERFKKGLISIDHPNLMTLDVSDLTPRESAETINVFVGNILEKIL